METSCAGLTACAFIAAMITAKEANQEFFVCFFVRWFVYLICKGKVHLWPVPVAAWSKAWVCGRSPAGIVGSNPTGGMNVCRM